MECVLGKFRRPQNIFPIIQAFREQDVSCRVTLIDSADKEEPSAGFAAKEGDRYFRVPNVGAVSRFSALAFHTEKFTYFHDNAMLPGTRVLSHFLASARDCPEFGVLVQTGRIFPQEMHRYSTRTVPRGKNRLPVDMAVRGYFVRTENLHHVLNLVHRVGSRRHEEDFMLCCGIRYFWSQAIISRAGFSGSGRENG